MRGPAERWQVTMKIHVVQLLIHLINKSMTNSDHNDSKSSVITMIREVALVARAFT